MVKKLLAAILFLLSLTACELADSNVCEELAKGSIEIKLSNAILTDNLQAAKEAVEDGANLNETAGENVYSDISPNDKNTISLCTVQNSAEDIALYLLGKGADPNYSKGSATLLMSEIAINNTTVCRELISRGADINACNGKQNVLSYLLKEGELNHTKELIDLIYDSGFKDTQNTLYAFLVTKAKQSVFHAESIDELAYVVKKACSSDKKNARIPELVYQLAQGNNKEAQKLLDQNDNDWIAMQDFAALFACSFCDKTTLQQLIKKGVDFKSVVLDDNPNDITLTDLATAYNSWDVVCFLKEQGINNTSSQSAFKMSLMNTAHQEVFKKVHEKNKDSKLSELNHSQDIILCAVQNDRVDFFEAFHSKLNTIDSYEYKTALSTYINDISDDLINYFVENGYADLFSEILGEIDCKLERYKQLCAKIKDINAISENGLAALHGATQNGNKECVAYLLSIGSDVNQKDSLGNTALHYASENGNKDIIEKLLNNKADINAVNDEGDTPLIKAVNAHSYETVSLLLKSGADREIQNSEGLTAERLAEQCSICGINDKMEKAFL